MNKSNQAYLRENAVLVISMRDVNRTFRKYIAVHITQVIGLLTLMKFVNLETGEIVYAQSAKREMLYMLRRRPKTGTE